MIRIGPDPLRSLFLCLLLVLVFLPLAVGAEKQQGLADSRQRLAELQKELETTLQSLTEKQGEESDLRNDLGALQGEIRRVEGMVKKSQKELDRLTVAINTAEQRMKSLQSDLGTSRRLMEQRLVALYKGGEVGLLKFLFSEKISPAVLLERHAFLNRMANYDRQLISEYRRQLQEEQAVLEELTVARNNQQTLADRNREQQQTLNAAKSVKRKLLASIRNDQKLLDGLLNDLRAREAQLNDLVKRLEQEQPASYTGESAGLSAAKGMLPWPLDGLVRIEFGTSQQGELGTLIDSKGLEIEAEVETPVRSIAAGTVLFAKQMRGFGKLMIVDHGSKDYSLYAHLSRLNKAVGDSVTGGEVLGHSGFEGRDSIYFEIRHGGQPLNPAEWLIAR